MTKTKTGLTWHCKITHTNKDWKVLQVIDKQNTIVREWEDFIAKFLSYLASSKYDAWVWATQDWYMDFMSIWVWFVAGSGSTDTVLKLPYKPVGVADGETGAFDWKTVTILSGAQAWETWTVDTNWYTPGDPSITLTLALPWALASWDQFVIGTAVEENWLQGEDTADGDGVTFTTSTDHRQTVSAKTVQADTNEVIVQAQWASVWLTWWSTIKLVELWLHNNATNGSWVTPSGDMFAKLEFGSSPINMWATDTVTVSWRFTIWTDR